MQTQRECTQFTHLCIYEYQVVRPWLSGDGWALIGTICTQLSSIIIHVNYNKVHMQTADPYPCSLVLGNNRKNEGSINLPLSLSKTDR